MHRGGTRLFLLIRPWKITDTVTGKREGFRATNHQSLITIIPMPVVLVEKKGPCITVLTLNRPERRNALSLQLLTELIAAIKMASDEPQERVLVLRGAGAAFCTGL